MRSFRELLRSLTCTHPAEWTSDPVEHVIDRRVVARFRHKCCMRCGRLRRVPV